MSEHWCQITMARYRLGPRPPDFDEVHVKCSPTFHQWLLLSPGSELVYACRTFMRGGVNEEERLMRRIMMTRRHNLREQDILQRAREAAAMEMERSHQHGRGGAGMTTTTTTTNGGMEGDDNDHHAVVTTNLAISDCLPLPLPRPPSPVNGNLSSLGASYSKHRCRAARSKPLSNEAVLHEMDVMAVERT